MKIKIFLTVAGVIAALVSCGTSNKATSVYKLGGEWSIVKVNGEEIKEADVENEPFIGFNIAESRVYGSTSCNRLTGGLEADAKTGKINFGHMGSTRMMCAKMDVEQKVLDALNSVDKFKFTGNETLELSDKTGKKVMELKKK